MIALIEKKLKIQWSPDQISGWMKKQDFKDFVSHETIYKYVWEDKKKGGLLCKHLRHKGRNIINGKQNGWKRAYSW